MRGCATCGRAHRGRPGCGWSRPGATEWWPSVDRLATVDQDRSLGEDALLVEGRHRHCAGQDVEQAPGHGRSHRTAVAGLLERSEEHTSELQSLMRISYAVFCLKKKTTTAN